MPRLRALNESSSDESEEDNEERETIEAQEDRAFSLYKQALEFRQRGNYPEAEDLLISILNDDFLASVSPEELSDGHARPAAALKYACLKNLGNVLVLQSRAEDGLKCFIQAVELDNSDVTMWYQMGKVALQIDDFHLASRAFQEGLRCNSRHWPCLDSLLPLLFALNDYLGCLLLVSRTLELDAEYPQALALQNQISKEDINLIQNFKFFFPEEKDISEVCCDLPEEELLNLISPALSLQERYKSKIPVESSEDFYCAKIDIKLKFNTWEDLGKNLLEVHKSIMCSEGKSFLQFVKINVSESSKPSEIEPIVRKNTIDNAVENIVAPPCLTDIESEPMDVDSEQEAKGEDQTEEDATEASGLEQDEEPKTSTAVQQNSSVMKQKRKKSSTTLMDQWSKRRSGRRTGRKAEEREESNLASCFRSLLPDSLLPKDLEAELAKASRRRSLRDPAEILWGDDSMDTMELCRLLQERDAKDDHKRKIGLLAKDIVPQRILQENYFGTEKEVLEVLSIVEKHGSETNNIIQLLVAFIRQLAGKHTLTWPPGLVPIYVELYECMRKHVSCPSPFDSTGWPCISILDLLESLLYCELYVDMWHQKSLNDSDNLGESGLAFSEALGNVTVLSGLSHIFTSSSEQCRILLRIHWLKVHLFLLQEDSASAIHSLQNVLDSIEIVETMYSVEDLEDVPHSISKDFSSNNFLSKSSEEKIRKQSTKELIKIEQNLNTCVVEVPEDIEEQSGPKCLNQSVGSAVVAKNSAGTDVDMDDVTELNASAVKGEHILDELTPVESSSEINNSFTPSVVKLDKENCDGDNSVLISTPLKNETINRSEAGTEKEALTDEICCIQPIDTISSETVAEPDGISEAVQDTNDNKELARENSDQQVEDIEKTDQLIKNPKTHENVADLLGNDQSELNTSQPTEIQTSAGAHKSIDVSEQSGSSSTPMTKTKSFIVVLPNCSVNQEITKRTTQKLLTSLTRQQQLSEVDDLYQSGQYELLAGTLTECFQFCAQQTDNDISEFDNLPDRATQMAMLLDSLWQLKKYPDCFYWGEACLHEAFNRYLNSTDTDNTSQDQDDHQMWATTVERLLAGLNDCLKAAGLKLMEKLPKNCLTRLVQTLTTILCQQLEQSDCSVELAIECTTPWVILHRIVFFEEQQHPIEQDCIPSHMSILFTAHEYMAKKGRCCLNEGILLNLVMDVVVAQLQSEELKGVRNQLNHEVDQAILCLYGHPKKPVERNRKRLQDHKVHQQLELTWDRSLALLRFYEPDELPTYDSISKISPEEEQLFLKISQLVPYESNPNRYLGKVKAFLKGSTDTLPEVQCSIPQAACNLYYLLANYYMKTFKWEPAIKYYMLDVCLNPCRFDSWAGMALARAASLTSDLNSCDTFDNDVQLHRKTKAQRCFQKAVDLEPENTTMWIEFGSFAYTVHSFCSRLLKTETDSLSMEMFTKIEEEKDKMLSLTEQCFKTVEKLDQEEPWLPQYMLGKVAEKRGEAPAVFLQHYRAAAKLLFESNAAYPLSLNYDPPQHYAFEAHEVHYRIHASILKHLEVMEGKYLSEDIERLFEETLNEAAEGPFMAARGMPQALAKRQSVDPVENIGKKLKLDESVMSNLVAERDCKLTKAEVKDICSSSMQSFNNVEVMTSSQEINLNKLDISVATSNGQPSQIDLSNMDASVSHVTEKMEVDCEIIPGIGSSTSAVERKSNCSPPKEIESESCQSKTPLFYGLSMALVSSPTNPNSVISSQSSPMTIVDTSPGSVKVPSGVDCSGDKPMHGIVFVVAEHDYVALYEDAAPDQSRPIIPQLTFYGNLDTNAATIKDAHTFKLETNSQHVVEVPAPLNVSSDSLVPSTLIHCKNEEKDNTLKLINMNKGTLCADSRPSSSRERVPHHIVKTEVVTLELGEDESPSAEKLNFDDSSVIGCASDASLTAEAKNKENILAKKNPTTTEEIAGSLSPSLLCSNSKTTVGFEQSGKDCLIKPGCSQDLTKETKDVSFVKPVADIKSPSIRSLDHRDLVNQCLVAMEECLARYPRHYKSFYRLCHHYFRSKQHRNLKKCRQLLLGDNRLPQSSKNISGLFKSNGVHSMFNDVWRMPIEEIDRAGSFASHMSRCVHLLMELLRALRDHAFLLKLSVFLKRDPEKKDKKYLRDNERADLSKQALVLCLAVMRECVNETRTADHVIELYKTVKEGIKELPLKESSFKTLLSDAYRKIKGLSRDQNDQQSYYEVAVDFCLKELNCRKAIADAKCKSQAQQGQVHPQVQMQAQVQAQVQAQAQAQVQDQLNAQVLAQAMQMGVNVMSSTLPFNTLSQRFPSAVNSLSNPLADARANAMANAMVSSMANSMANSMFLPQMPLYRGRGRPPKAQQRLHNAMMNMAHMMGLANVPPSGSNVMDSSKSKVMKQQQKQRRSQQVSGAQTTVVSSIIKDRPALSITALQAKTTAQSATTVSTPPSASISTAPMRAGSPYSHSDGATTGQTGWQRPRHNGPRPMPGATDPRSMLNPGMARKEGPRFKGPGTSNSAFASQPSRPFAPQSQSNMQLNHPAALLSRLPGLQVKHRPHPVVPHQPDTSQLSQPCEKLQKNQMASVQTSKPAISISKISTPPFQSTQGSNTSENSEAKKKADPNFDIITLD